MARRKRSPANADVIPCSANVALQEKIDRFADTLKTEAHKLGDHGLSEDDFYRSGLFNGAIQTIRGEVAADMKAKRQFVAAILDYMHDKGFIKEWQSAGELNRHDYTITLQDGRVSVVELKGCLDGNNTTIFERPTQANEFIIWSICSNAGADPKHNVWSGIHTRLSPVIIHEGTLVDGLVVWDWLCGGDFRPCPKVIGADNRRTTIKQYRLPPPCLYLFPPTIPSVRSNPDPEAHTLESVGFLKALHECFGGSDTEVNRVRFHVEYRGKNVVRTTTIERGGTVRHQSKATPIKRNK